MNYRRLPELDLASFIENLRNLLEGTELSAIDPALRAQLLAEIGTLPEDLAMYASEAEAAKAARKAAVSSRNVSSALSRKAAGRVRDTLNLINAPKSLYDLCGFEYHADPVSMYVCESPTRLIAVGYFNGVNRLRFTGNNPHSQVVYEIYRRPSRDVPWTMIAATPKQSHRDTPVTPGQFYQYRVRAVAAKNSSDYSNEAIVYGVV